MTFINCPACHAPNPVDYRFCENCGGVLVGNIPAENIPTENVPAENIEPIIEPNSKSSVDDPTIINFEQPPISPQSTNLELDQLILTRLECAAASVVGRTRNHNEDHFWFGWQQLRQCGYEESETITYRGAFILCDGMGGHDGGEIASEIATKTLKQQLAYFWSNGLPEYETFQEYIHHANQVIWEQNQQQNRQRMGRMGTTLVMLLVDGQNVAVGHVGDSRLYCVTTDLGFSNTNPTGTDGSTNDQAPASAAAMPENPLANTPDEDAVVSETPNAELFAPSSGAAINHNAEQLDSDVSDVNDHSDYTDHGIEHETDPDGLDINATGSPSSMMDYAPQALLEQLTEDHEVATQLIMHGLAPEIAYGRPDAHQLTQALGPNLKIEPTISYFTLNQNTLFLLCSDGLCDNDLVEQYWQDHLLPLCYEQVDLTQGVTDLVNFADRINGHDNITALLVRCSLTEAPVKSVP